MPFTTEIRISPIIEGTWRTWWKVVEPLMFRSEKTGKIYIVPAGTYTDLASGFVAAASAAAILHDHLYADGHRLRQVENREEADDIFLEAMESSGVPTWRAWMYYNAVRLFGWRYYRPAQRISEELKN